MSGGAGAGVIVKTDAGAAGGGGVSSGYRRIEIVYFGSDLYTSLEREEPVPNEGATWSCPAPAYHVTQPRRTRRDNCIMRCCIYRDTTTHVYYTARRNSSYRVRRHPLPATPRFLFLFSNATATM